MTSREKLQSAALQELARRRQYAVDVVEHRIDRLNRQIPAFSLCRDTLTATRGRLARIIVRGGEKRDEAIAALRAENKRAEENLKRLLAENGYPADYLEPAYTCPVCHDVGYVNGRACGCLAALKSEWMLSELQKAHTLQGYSFDDFSLTYYSDRTDRETGVVPAEHMGQILEYCRHYADGFTRQSDSLLFLGKTGLGKTHLSLAVAQEAAKKGYIVRYGSAQEHLRQLEREHFSREQSDDTLDVLLDCDLLIIDDLGSEFPSSFTAAMIYQLIDARLAHGIPTIISTNLSWQELEERYTQRVVSRLASSYLNLRFLGQDIRQQKRFDG